jgi:hypothetical protein
MPAAYPINSYQPVIAFDGEPDPSMGMLGQVAVDVNSGAYSQKIGGKWYPFGQGPLEPVLTTLQLSSNTDNAPADGTAINNLIITAQDQNGLGMQVMVNITTDSSTANLSLANAMTNTNGTVSVTVTNTVAEAVNVTATSGGQTAQVVSTFVEASRGVRSQPY